MNPDFSTILYQKSFIITKLIIYFLQDFLILDYLFGIFSCSHVQLIRKVMSYVAFSQKEKFQLSLEFGNVRLA